MTVQRRRLEDQNLTGWRAATCWIAQRASEFWEWVDKRDLDKHLVSLFILAGTVKITSWAMDFAENGDRPGLEVAAIIGAVVAPYMALQAAAVAFYFRARQ